MWAWTSKILGPLFLYLIDAFLERWNKQKAKDLAEKEKRAKEDSAKEEALKKLHDSGKDANMTDEQKEKEIEKALDEFRRRITDS
jgi:hypothetical protein